MVQLLIGRGAGLNIPDSKTGRRTNLINATSREYVEFAKLLISRGADVNVQTATGDSPILTTVWRKNLGLFKLLIDHGADVNVKDKYGVGQSPD